MSEDLMKTLDDSIKTLSRYTLALFLGLLLVFGLGLRSAYQQRDELHREVQRIDSALCEFVDDLERRIESSRDFLDRHPRGIEGISAKDIRRSIQNQRLTIRSLSELDCR